MKIAEELDRYGNNISDKSFQFALRIVNFYKFALTKNRSVEILLKQVLKSGTSIGANVAESKNAVSKSDFINKLAIALKEARETEYWLKLLFESKSIQQNEFDSLSKDCDEIIRLLTSIIKTLKTKRD